MTALDYLPGTNSRSGIFSFDQPSHRVTYSGLSIAVSKE